MISPPKHIIESAERIAKWSECSKSSRGVVIYDALRNNFYLASGYNSPPVDRDGVLAFQCDNSSACRANCGKRCVHAEMNALSELQPGDNHLTMVHVKLGLDGKVSGNCMKKT